MTMHDMAAWHRLCGLTFEIDGDSQSVWIFNSRGQYLGRTKLA